MFNFTVHAIHSCFIICQTETNNHPIQMAHGLLNDKWQRKFEIRPHIVASRPLY